MTKSSN